MPNRRPPPSNALIYAVAAVAVCGIIAVTLLLLALEKSQIPEAWLALFIGLIGSTLGTMVGLSRTEQINKKVDDLSNGKMDDKIEKGVRKVMDERDEAAVESDEEPSQNTEKARTDDPGLRE